LAAYYGRGQVRDEPLMELAKDVAAGSLAFSDALDNAVCRYLQEGGNPDLVDAAEDRLGRCLADLTFRLQEGLDAAPVAVIRPDLHPLAAAGLGLDREALL